MNVNSISNGVAVNGNPKAKPNPIKEAGKAMLFSGVVSTAVSTPFVLIPMHIMPKLSEKLSPEAVELVNQAADNIWESKGLAEKGVAIINLSDSGVTTSGIANFFKNLTNPESAVRAGKNAAFNPRNNCVVINREKFSLATFHELGHAYNFNISKFMHFVQKLRLPAMILPAVIALYGALGVKSEPENGKELTKLQKANNFVRNNAGKLAFAASLPIVAEEICASVRGCLWAKEFLSKDLAKKVLQTNIAGGISYVAFAFCVGLGARLAVKVKDNIRENNKIEMSGNASRIPLEKAVNVKFCKLL